VLFEGSRIHTVVVLAAVEVILTNVVFTCSDSANICFDMDTIFRSFVTLNLLELLTIFFREVMGWQPLGKSEPECPRTCIAKPKI